MILQRSIDVLARSGNGHSRDGHSRDVVMLEYIRARIHHDDVPSFEEIAAAQRCSVRTVIETMRRLKRQGLVDWDPLRPHSMVLCTGGTTGQTTCAKRSDLL